MIPKSKQKKIIALSQKKQRKNTGLFIVEGEKIVLGCIQKKIIFEDLFITEQFKAKYKTELKEISYEIADSSELEKFGNLKTNAAAIAIVKFQLIDINWNDINNSFSLILDGVRDPGNLGTIIRIADWYGIKNIICTEDCVDHTNPKVLQSTMGSFFNVNVHYLDSEEIERNINNLSNFSIYSAEMDGENIRNSILPKNGVLIMGSESHGVRIKMKNQQKITIPKNINSTTESLNVAIATAICCERLLA